MNAVLHGSCLRVRGGPADSDFRLFPVSAVGNLGREAREFRPYTSKINTRGICDALNKNEKNRRSKRFKISAAATKCQYPVKIKEYVGIPRNVVLTCVSEILVNLRAKILEVGRSRALST